MAFGFWWIALLIAGALGYLAVLAIYLDKRRARSNA
jgi:hypothetical protein